MSIDYDLELQHHHAAFLRACSIGRSDDVVDIGCGAGASTRDAGRLASEGRVLGIDRSQAMIERARALTLTEGLGNVTYQHADVEHYAFAPRQHDVAISRFGTMFFSDPGSAFAKICAALKPRARLVMMVWQAREENEWAVEIERALGSGGAAGHAQAFSLADQRSLKQLLARAGFVDAAFECVHEPVCYGPDAERAFAFVSRFLLVQEALDALTAEGARCALDQLRHVLAAHQTVSGVWFDSRAWIVAARRYGDG